MQNLACLILCVCLFSNTYCQNTVVVTEGTKLIISGHGALVLGGGNFINNGSVNGLEGTLFFRGPVTYSGTGAAMVERFNVSHLLPGISLLNAPISVINTATLMFGNLNANNNLMIRSDMNDIANMVVSGAPSGIVNGIVTRPSVRKGSCPSFSSTLSLNISGPMILYQWQSSSDSLSWANIPGATNETYTTVVTSTTYYRCFIRTLNTDFINMPIGVKLTMDTPLATIRGISSLLKGDTSTLTGMDPGGSWRSSDSSVMTVDQTGMIQGISPGRATISYSVTNTNGCSAVAQSLVAIIARPQVKVTGVVSTCFPSTIDLPSAIDIPGSDTALVYSYYSDPAAMQVLADPGSIAVAGTYYIKGRNSAGIYSEAVPVSVIVHPLPSGTLSSIGSTVLCGASATLDLRGTGGNSYAWFRNGAAINGITGDSCTVTTAGEYTVTLINQYGCQAAAGNTVSISMIQHPKAAFDYDSYCINSPIAFSDHSIVAGSGRVSYQWKDDAGNISASVSPAFTYGKAGSVAMKLKVTSESCPLLADSVLRILTIEQPTTALRMQPVNIMANEPSALQARNFANSYRWTPATGLSNPAVAGPMATIGKEQEYLIIIRTPASCITVDTLQVRVFDRMVFVPNVFTPNNDGVNDKLFVNLAGATELHVFRVFNRYGKMIFETTNAATGWDGTYNNILQPMDTYVWMVEVTLRSGNRKTQTGSVTLLR